MPPGLRRLRGRAVSLDATLCRVVCMYVYVCMYGHTYSESMDATYVG